MAKTNAAIAASTASVEQLIRDRFGVEPAFLFRLFIASKAHPDFGAHHGSVKPGALNLPTAFRALRAGEPF